METDTQTMALAAALAGVAYSIIAQLVPTFSQQDPMFKRMFTMVATLLIGAALTPFFEAAYASVQNPDQLTMVVNALITFLASQTAYNMLVKPLAAFAGARQVTGSYQDQIGGATGQLTTMISDWNDIKNGANPEPKLQAVMHHSERFREYVSAALSRVGEA